MEIEKKYRKLTDIEHVLLRPGMYVGSTKSRKEELYLDDGEKFSRREVTYNPAFLKIFDEIVSNSSDEHRRNPKLNKLEVLISPELGQITVRDNGGIPVVRHKTHDEWVPELIFSNLKAGSNFNDTEDRLGAGTNGVGSTLTNIYSLVFHVRTCDGENIFDQVFEQNMTKRGPPTITPAKGQKGFTEIRFVPDLARFEMSSLDPDHVDVLTKRCVELAACNPNLKVSVNGEDYSFSSFKQYCEMFSPPNVSPIYEEVPRWKVGIFPSDGAFRQVSFVNSVDTKDGGSHVDYISNQIVSWVRDRIKRKHKFDLKPAEIRNHLFLVIQADISNPAFSSQTKEKLITEPKDFGSKFELPEKLLKEIFASEIIQRILDWAQQKADAEERKQLRELNKNLSKGKLLKLIDAKVKEGRYRCRLALFEGDCLRDDTPVLLFRPSEGFVEVPGRDVVEGDLVVTHENNLKRVTAVSRKISRLHTIRISPTEEIYASGSHRLQVYDRQSDEFLFVRVDHLTPGRHQLVRNRLSQSRGLAVLHSVTTTDDGSLLIETSEGPIRSSPGHKFAVLDLMGESFGMVEASNLHPETHILVLKMILDSSEEVCPR